SSGTPYFLSGIWGSGASDVWAVGASAILRRGGSACWRGSTSATNSSCGECRVGRRGGGGGGGGGSRPCADDTACGRSATSACATALFLCGIWGSGESDVWAVGASTILHWDGSAWMRVSSSATNGLSGVWGSGGSDVWAVGVFGTILHWDGSAWMRVSSSATN